MIVEIDNARIAVRPPRPTDQSYLAATWVTSLVTHSKANTRGETNRLVDRLLDDASVRILIACEPTNTDKIDGWICYTPTPRALVLHYAYVRDKMRRRGIGRAMLAKAMGTKTSTKLAYTMTGPTASALLARWPDAVHVPIREFLG